MFSQVHYARVALGLAGLRVSELHGDMKQQDRLENLDAFRSGKTDVLFATDIAARGLDIPSVTTVINFEMPNTLTTYIHRVGRTARAERSGCAVTLADDSSKTRAMLKQIMRDAPSACKRRCCLYTVCARDGLTLIHVCRTVPVVAVQAAAEAISAAKPRVDEVLEEEKLAQRMAEAQRDVNRAENLIKHANEISVNNVVLK